MKTAENMIGIYSPWGEIQTCRRVYPGLYVVTTCSHGGYYVDDTRLEMIPDYIVRASFVSRSGRAGERSHWFEEDCDWALVALVFPAAFPAEAQEQARRTLSNMHDEYRAALAKWDARTETYNAT